MDVKATLVEKTSKNGNQYKAIEIQLTDTYKKMVFLDNAELEILKMSKQNNENQIDTEFWK